MPQEGAVSTLDTKSGPFRKARMLRAGDKVAILSPSWGGPSLFPHVYDRGLEFLRRHLGLEPVEFPTARMSPERLRSRPEERAADLNAAFGDPSIVGIIASIGGDDSVRVLRFLDKKVITSNPKLMMGYSDFTTLLAYINWLGNVTFHGPAVMAGLSQGDALGTVYRAHLSEMLMDNPPIHVFKQFARYSEGYPDWANKDNVGKVNSSVEANGWLWKQKASRREGYFWGGNIEVLESMKGTDFWPGRPFFDDKILLLETSEEVPTPHHVERFLRNYGTQGILDRIQGLIVGRAKGYSPEQKVQLETSIRRIVIDEHSRTDMPIVLEFDIGHTDPQFIVPFGVLAEIDAESGRIAIIDRVYSEA